MSLPSPWIGRGVGGEGEPPLALVGRGAGGEGELQFARPVPDGIIAGNEWHTNLFK